jgi:hypothetical protein
MDDDQFYLQDSRGFVGNDMLFWAKEGKGYTTDISKAELYSKATAQRMHNSRPTDIPWPKDYIDNKTRPAVDMQHVNRNEALRDTEIVLTKFKKPKKEVINCIRCGRFLSVLDVYCGAGCPSCGADNRP